MLPEIIYSVNKIVGIRAQLEIFQSLFVNVSFIPKPLTYYKFNSLGPRSKFSFCKFNNFCHTQIVGSASFWLCDNYSPTEGRPTNIARSRMSSWSGVFCMARKNKNFYAQKSNQVAASGRFRHDHVTKRTSPLFGINQMLVSATGGEGSSPSKNHVKIVFIVAESS